MLLSTLGSTGILYYQDITTGRVVAKMHTFSSTCPVMKPSKVHPIVCLGHENGFLYMWSPKCSRPIVKMLSHRGAITSIANDQSGLYMVSGGMDGRLRIWDLRTLRPLQQYCFSKNITCCDISPNGQLALGNKHTVHILKNVIGNDDSILQSRTESLRGYLKDIIFSTNEDVLITGHSMGVESILVTGASSITEIPNKHKSNAKPQYPAEKLQPDSFSCPF